LRFLDTAELSQVHQRISQQLQASITVSATPDKNLSPRMPFSSGVEVLLPRTKAVGVAAIPHALVGFHEYLTP
jgi:hypothetical protein